MQGYVEHPKSSSSQGVSLQTKDQPKPSVGLASRLKEGGEGTGFSVYLRVYVNDLYRGVWYRFRYRNGKYHIDDGMKNGVTHILEKEEVRTTCHSYQTVLDNRVYKISGQTDILVLDIKQVPTTSNLLRWNKAPSLIWPRQLPMITCLNSCIYVIDDRQIRYTLAFLVNRDHGWGEVLRPQSTGWELLSSPSPEFGDQAYIFFHGVDELDKLIIGSLEENLLYLYDAKTTMLEKVENFMEPYYSYYCWSYFDTIVVGRYHMWCLNTSVFMNDLVERKQRDWKIEGFKFGGETTKLMHLGGDRFCYYAIENGTRFHMLEFSLGGEPPYNDGSSLHPHVTSYFKHIIELGRDVRSGILLMDG